MIAIFKSEIYVFTKSILRLIKSSYPKVKQSSCSVNACTAEISVLKNPRRIDNRCWRLRWIL